MGHLCEYRPSFRMNLVVHRMSARDHGYASTVLAGCSELFTYALPLPLFGPLCWAPFSLRRTTDVGRGCVPRFLNIEGLLGPI